jgi:hypothetical protein
VVNTSAATPAVAHLPALGRVFRVIVSSLSDHVQ